MDSITLKSPISRKILVINCGSSSLKFTLFDTDKDGYCANGQVDRIGTGKPMGLSYEGGDSRFDKDIEAGDHKIAFEAMLKELTSKKYGVIESPDEISAVGHRVVHGGDAFYETTILTDEVIAKIEEISGLAPLHNPVNIVGIREAIKVFPKAKHAAVFDTAFHHTMPNFAFLYGLPYEYYSEKKIRRYGFHGTSHRFVSTKAAEFIGKKKEDLKIISCHLGNGGSVTAINAGKSVDTSMGLTPAEGVIMGTRSGSIDPAILLYLMDNYKMTSADLNKLLNKQSGLLGISGISNDMRDIAKAADDGNERAIAALKTFGYSVKKYVGSYLAVLGGADIIIFTGGIGLWNDAVRKEAVGGLEKLGIKLDPEKNKKANGTKTVSEISDNDSKTKILVIPTNEELMIASEMLEKL
ncbi:MAG: acetate kinase [Chitinispirillales bacterium]|jgi:acetate kinase|nr:acetate kinase [Chitinispirillales bacterium]